MSATKALFSVLLASVWLSDNALAAPASYASLASREEIVAQARKEGRVRIVASMEPANIKATTAAFTKKYPFIEAYVQETKGSDSDQRLLLEIKSGKADWDVIPVATDFASEYPAYLWQIDLIKMAQQKILDLPIPMIDPKQRNILASFNHFQVTAYNATLVPADKVPSTWEDLLRPEWKGKKIAADIRPSEIAALVPAWGLEKTLDFARKLAAQQPIWVRGASRTLTSIMAGEIPMMIGPNFNSVKKIQLKDRAGLLQYVSLQPVPVRFGNAQAILSTSRHRQAALLWMEWLLSPEAQKINDETQFNSSVHVPGSLVERELRGKKLSVVDWEHHQSMEQWIAKVVEAYGFPTAEGQR